MALSDLDSFLRLHRRVALDTAIFIYHLEANPKYLPLTDRIFAWLEAPGHHAVTSTITMTELLVQPYRVLNQRRVDDFYGLLSTHPGIGWLAPDLKIADLAARIRAAHQLRTPDALQAATAVYSQATALLTNDAVFDRVRGLQIFVLDRVL